MIGLLISLVVVVIVEQVGDVPLFHPPVLHLHEVLPVYVLGVYHEVPPIVFLLQDHLVVGSIALEVSEVLRGLHPYLPLAGENLQHH